MKRAVREGWNKDGTVTDGTLSTHESNSTIKEIIQDNSDGDVNEVDSQINGNYVVQRVEATQNMPPMTKKGIVFELTL